MSQTVPARDHTGQPNEGSVSDVTLISDGVPVPNGINHTNDEVSTISGLNGTHHAGQAPSKASNTTSTPMQESPAFTPARSLHVLTIGAGYSGMILAHRLQHTHATSPFAAHITHTIIESKSESGGTWVANTYPGVQCDVPSHIYAFPFAPSPDWSRFYSTGEEIRDYFQRTVKEWGLDKHVQYDTTVEGAYWDESRSQWRVEVRHNSTGLRTEWADILISARGVLSHWRWPTISGLETFKGHRVHSADWVHTFDYSQKRIGVIGNGSSAIQILPQMAALPGTQVTSFQRTPTWIVSRHTPAKLVGSDDPSPNPEYRPEDKERFRNPEELKKYRKTIIGNVNRGFRVFVKESAAQEELKAFATKQMSEKLGNDPVLCRKLIPDWPVGCRRVTPGSGYLESFTRENVKLTMNHIDRVDEDGIWTKDGTYHELDVIVCATGFDVSQRPQFPVVGRDGMNLGEMWKDEPESYMSVAAPNMPNYFIFTGPNATVGHGSLIFSLQWAADWMIKWMRKMLEEDIASIVPRQEVVDEFVRYGDEIMKRFVWTSNCRSWYKSNRIDGRVTATFAGSALLFQRMIENPRPEDFEIRYRAANRFRFMGNGFMGYELEDEVDGKEVDLGWYVEH
ncbi:putative sterigmatocystin biosynthesis monooxygenase stcW [Cyphellophora attinorum]|uniref:Putative sterigmatocystin biosynthesis monooxygenase stcW n=1 Tax=Cyphellophora attinorum TaxID=1664694 RepID=A0A0N0NK21_9EURO|nr:putative sterigmatocystin biosynthesis monooxygenase stcW [Phialophora attinorum]KPI37641.1 putative sterigmatocystin biosynthesis monooxygenase stcW [Phialophora attinorum]